ncbi:Ppx/GppA phosphatase family protein [Paenibacillus sacheonensis]|uniref:Ppx/GppA family phosphatase n=1 Tax=Paenibacillus sacheonensis TaxID=742054 RepID=A0A7X5BYF2_9BACL|nr:Ppx/GppA phosphatase family protein [Paenibacillus sacheonensis]MBM7565425.1 exopolyphosphatase/guanosine-5'-triphosphate,3'-diphosphate pyrophosphatase [Paenibacillus sacheonensis]NBC69647.1 Ppx/GppA family phosphatase [Paenibacillus sacheonensis]
MTEQRIGIIDIGSNSIRLVVYERTSRGAHRVIDGSKRAARLSEHLDEDGSLPDRTIQELIDMINHFRLICAHHKTGLIRAVATAAIRNSTNRSHVLSRIESETGLPIELISGVEEAGFGFLGMINTMSVTDGFLIDIGGGSTEVSLFKNRELVRAVSFPFGCVSLATRFADGGMLSDAQLRELELHIGQAIEREAWLKQEPGLPLVGVGGTVRSLGKMHQAFVKYPFESTHNYPIEGQATDELIELLRKLPVSKRKNFPGLSKDRVDIIVPGLAILRSIFRTVGGSHYLICGAGLRDGLFFSTRFPERPRMEDVVMYSVNNLAAMHPEAPMQHTSQVNRIVLQLAGTLQPQRPSEDRSLLFIDIASTLHRIGASIDYYDYKRHTFYLMVNSRLNGLSHRELLICSMIASYKSKNRTKQNAALYRPLLSDEDIAVVCKLGTLLQLAIALDRSETQAIGKLVVETNDGKLRLHAVRASGSLDVERKEVEAQAGDFKKLWGLTPILL